MPLVYYVSDLEKNGTLDTERLLRLLGLSGKLSGFYYAVFINEGIPQSERLAKLNAIAISQMKVLTEDHRLLQLEAADDTEKPQ